MSDAGSTPEAILNRAQARQRQEGDDMKISKISKAVAVAVGTRIALLMNDRQLQRRALELESDMAKLARWGVGAGEGRTTTPVGQLIASKFAVLNLKLNEERKNNSNLLDELRRMRPIFEPIGLVDDSVAKALREVWAPMTPAWGRPAEFVRELAERFEAYEKQIHAEGGAKAPESASALTLPLSGRAAEAPPSGVIIGSYDTGVDKWVHGERNHEGRRFLGPCPMCGRRTVDHGSAWKCTNTRCELQALTTRPQPFWWNSDIAVARDGDMWRANRTSFVNLQESLCQFGHAPGVAVAFLVAAEKQTMTPGDNTTGST